MAFEVILTGVAVVALGAALIYFAFAFLGRPAAPRPSVFAPQPLALPRRNIGRDFFDTIDDGARTDAANSFASDLQRAKAATYKAEMVAAITAGDAPKGADSAGPSSAPG